MAPAHFAVLLTPLFMTFSQICQYGSDSRIVEDNERTIGRDITGWIHHDDGRPIDAVVQVLITGFPSGTTVSYTDTGGTVVTVVVDGDGYDAIFTADGEAKIRAALDTLTLTAPLHSDVDFGLEITVTTSASIKHSYAHPVLVQAVADPPSVSATESMMLVEDNSPMLLQIFADRSADDDNSETLSIRVTIPSDTNGSIGDLSATSVPSNVAFNVLDNGVYIVQAAGATPQSREAALDAFLSSNVRFQPRAQWAGVYLGDDGIKVEAISTEDATGGDLARPNNDFDGTVGDFDTKTEIAVAYVDVSVAPFDDIPYLTNTVTIVQENNLNSNVDEDLLIEIGKRLGMKCDDMDGSQSLNITLTGFPTNANDLFFGIATPDGVSANVIKTSGTVSIDGVNVVSVLLLLDSLKLTLAHDDDRNFLIEIEGTSKDTNGVWDVSDDFSMNHQVIVQAVADTPTLEVGNTTKTEVAEDFNTFTAYPVTIQLNDVDGSETYQNSAVTVTLSTPGDVAVGAEPQVEFLTLTGVNIAQPLPGQWVLTADDMTDIDAALESMMIRPGDHNGEGKHALKSVAPQCRQTNLTTCYAFSR
jgi:hypothetical protein